MRSRAKNIATILILTIVGLTAPIRAQQAGRIPTPVFQNVQIQSQATFDAGTGLYTYSYTVTNPATNTGEIWSINIDISKPSNGASLSSAGLTIPTGAFISTFDEELADFNGKNVPMIPVGLRLPQGWHGGLGKRGVADFTSGTDVSNILPGGISGGFELMSRGHPTIRQIEVEPWWIYVESENLTVEESQQEDQHAREIEASLLYKTKTLGPTAPPSPLDHKKFLNNAIRGYLNECATLGWLIDPNFKNTLLAQLDTANSFLDANDPTKAKITLQEFMTTIADALSTQRTTEAQGLLYFNAKYLKEQLPDTALPPPPPIPHLELTPKDATLHTLYPPSFFELTKKEPALSSA